MKKHEDSQEQNPEVVNVEDDLVELNDDELDEVAGGIIIVSTKPQSTVYSRFSKVAINPQPLPPKIFNIGSQ